MSSITLELTTRAFVKSSAVIISNIVYYTSNFSFLYRDFNYFLCVIFLFVILKMLHILIFLVLLAITWTYLFPLETFACSRNISYGWPYYWKINNLSNKKCGSHYQYFNKHSNCLSSNVIYVQ